MQPGRRRIPQQGVMLLAYQVFAVTGLKRIPPVTLAIVGLHTSIYLRMFRLPWYKASQVCISAYHVWYRRRYMRLLYSAFEHGDDWHLYYNMVSFILKGRALETRFGSVKFLYLTSAFTVLTNATYVGLALLASNYLNMEDYESHCAVGFSGVIFALKVLTSYYDPNRSCYVMGIPILIPANYAVWAELVLIQLLLPNASFIGHLAGILVGLAYVKGPLGFVLDSLYSSLAYFFDPPQQRPRFAPRAEQSGYHSNQNSSFFQYVPRGMSEEEQLAQAREASMQENANERPSAPNLYPNLDDIRTRRLARYQ